MHRCSRTGRDGGPARWRIRPACAMRRAARTLQGAFGRAVWALTRTAQAAGQLQSRALANQARSSKAICNPDGAHWLSNDKDGRLPIACTAAAARLVGDKVEPYPVRGAINSNKRSRTTISIRIDAPGTAMEASDRDGRGGSSMYITVGQMYYAIGWPQATSSSALEDRKAMSGRTTRKPSRFESCPSTIS